MDYLTEELILQKSSQQLTALLYEGLASLMQDATRHIDKKHFYEANQSLQKAGDIVHRLGVGLRNESGLIAENLDTLYSFLAEELIRVNLSKNMESISYLIQMVETLSEAWNEAMKMKQNVTADSVLVKVSAYENSVMRIKF